MKKRSFKRLFVFIVLLFPCLLFSKSLGNKAFLHIQNLVAFGTRVPESLGSLKAQAYIKKVGRESQWKGEELAFTAKTPLGNKKMKNIWFTYNDHLSSKAPMIILATHYDSKYFKDQVFLGVDDGLSGVGVLLSLMPVIAENQFKNVKIVFLFLDGEEAFENWSDTDSLYGSRKQVDYWEKKGVLFHISAFILLDMVGGNNLTFCKELNSHPTLTQDVFMVGLKLGYTSLFDLNCRVSVQDDHIPFMKKGVPVLDLIPSRFPSYWHTSEDTLDKINPESLNKVAKTMLSYIKAKNA